MLGGGNEARGALSVPDAPPRSTPRLPAAMIDVTLHIGDHIYISCGDGEAGMLSVRSAVQLGADDSPAPTAAFGHESIFVVMQQHNYVASRKVKTLLEAEGRTAAQLAGEQRMIELQVSAPQSQLASPAVSAGGCRSPPTGKGLADRELRPPLELFPRPLARRSAHSSFPVPPLIRRKWSASAR